MTKILILMFLAACKAPSIDTQIRKAWSFKFEQCYCQKYDLNKIEPLENFYRCGESNCEDLVGFSAEDWTDEITPWGRELRRYGEDELSQD